MPNHASKLPTDTCQFSYYTHKFCQRPVWDQSTRLCIFHCAQKPIDDFRRHLLAEIGDVNDNNDLQELDGQHFNFPENFEIHGLCLKKSANFENARFGSGTYFFDSRFEGKAKFNRARFGDDIVFHVVTFGCHTDFYRAKFEGRLELTEIESEGPIFFRNVVFDHPEKVMISESNLAQWHFARTDVEHFDFVECDWSRDKSRYVVQDETYLIDKQRSVPAAGTASRVAASPAEIEQLYSRLQKNFENNKRYSDAGNFYIGSMEMRRQQIAEGCNKKFLRWLAQNLFSLTAWYRNVSFYGERIRRCVIWMLSIVLLFPFLYLFTSFEYPTSYRPNELLRCVDYDFPPNTNFRELLSDYPKGLEASFYAFTFQQNMLARLTFWSNVVATLETAISATLLALFLLAIRRRFRR